MVLADLHQEACTSSGESALSVLAALPAANAGWPVMRIPGQPGGRGGSTAASQST